MQVQCYNVQYGHKYNVCCTVCHVNAIISLASKRQLKTTYIKIAGPVLFLSVKLLTRKGSALTV